jgi:carbamoyl-phosphate synthase large subunit
MMKKSAINVLVSAVGGDVGQAIVKSLILSKQKIVCYGCDIDENAVGKFFVESFHIVPPASDDNYILHIDKICLDLEIDAFIPASEPEIYLLGMKKKLNTLPSGTPVICQNGDILQKFGDKLTSMNELKYIVDLAPFADGKDPEAIQNMLSSSGFPLVVKERQSSGSKQIFVVRSVRELDHALALMDLPVIQEYIEDTYGEYSIGIFSYDTILFGISFKRKIGPNGASWDAEYSEDPEVLSYAIRIGEHIKPHGSINIQVRKSKEGVRLLEINPRFSSLTAARAIAGFNDAVWSVELALGIFRNPNPLKYKKIRFKRYLDEIVDFGDGFTSIPAWYLKTKE